jgi:hypothetical protein
MLEQAGHGISEERLSLLYGAFLEIELAALARTVDFADLRSVYITGPSALAAAWKKKLSETQCDVSVPEEKEREEAYIEGSSVSFSSRGSVVSSPRSREAVPNALHAIHFSNLFMTNFATSPSPDIQNGG